MRDIINVLVYCIIIERKNAQDTQMIRSLASNVLLQVSAKSCTYFILLYQCIFCILSNIRHLQKENLKY